MLGRDFMQTTKWWKDVLDHNKSSILKIIEGIAADIEVKDEKTMVIMIAGQSALGKSAFSHQLARYIGRPHNVVDLDTYLIPREERVSRNPPISGQSEKAVDFDSALFDILSLKRQRKYEFSYYSHETGERRSDEEAERIKYKIKLLDGPDYLILEGAAALHCRINSLADMKIFITATEGTQLELLTRTQVVERGFSPEASFDTARVKIREFKTYGKQFGKDADIVLLCDRSYRYSIKSVKCIDGEG